MRFSLIMFLILIASPLMAATFDHPMPDRALESRAQALFHRIRCVVCDSASIAESPAEVASDMRAAIRKKIQEGLDDHDILQWLESRYGSAIYMQPQNDSLLWLAPFMILLMAVLAGRLYFRKPPS